ncbi:unnamed protein product [Urochloa humidicola]
MAVGPPPFAVVALLVTAIAALLLAATSATSSPAAADNHSGGRMATIIIRAHGARVPAAAASGGSRSKWHEYDRRWRLLEDEVAPEFGGLLGGHISADPLIKDRAACTSNCAGKGEPYTRPCIYKNQCNG